jgi:2-polyprenyl-3-methyl-5-hydroxy-6-metoxy-1,4-benzoquinol methylase
MSTSPAEPAVDLRMKPFDRLIQKRRIDQVAPYIEPGARVLDIGSADGKLFRRFEEKIGEGIGIDPGLEHVVEGDGWSLHPGWFPEDLPDTQPFDVIAMLAVLEHIPADEQEQVARDVASLLRPGGHLVVTVPSLLVDPIVDVLVKLRIMTAVAFEQHYGFDPSTTPEVMSVDGMRLVKRKRFELGLNNAYVFRQDRDAVDG